MKKNLFKSMLLGFAALTALNASADLKITVEDFEIEPGKTGWTMANVYAESSGIYSALQFELKQIEGMSDFNAFKVSTADQSQTEWPKVKSVDDETGEEIEAISVWSPAFNIFDGEYRVVLNYMANGIDGYVAHLPAGKSLVCRIAFKADASFTGADLVLKHAKADYRDPSAPEGWVNSQEITEEQVLCHISVPATATPLATIVAEGVDDTEYTVAEALRIVSKAPKAGCVFVSDGAGNWMKVAAEGEVYDAIAAMTDIKAGTLTGVLSDADCNQTLTVTKAPEKATTPVEVAIVGWNLAQGGNPETNPQYKFAPKVNEIINLTGYYFENEKAFRGYANQTGQSASVDVSWCNTDATLTNGAAYKNVECAVQLKAPWTNAETPAGAPAKIAATDKLSFQNYLVYPLSISENNIMTGVENLNASKDVVSVQYVNAAGMTSATPFQGVNIVVTRYADGSQVTTKVVK